MTDPSVAFQANFKTPGGGLHNVYAPDAATFAQRLQELYANAALIASTESVLSGAVAVGQGLPVAPPAAQPPQPAATPPPVAPWGAPSAPAAAAPVAAVPTCIHGPRVKRTGVNSSNGRPWTAHFCPQPKGAPDACEPVWG